MNLPMWKRLRVVAQIIVGVVALALLVYAIVRNWDAMSQALAELNPLLVAVSAVLILVGLYVNMLSWLWVVRALGVRLTVSEGASVFFTSQLGKYIPGGIWPVVASARLGKAFGLTALLSVSSMTIALLMSLTVASVIAIGVLFLVPALASDYIFVPILLLLAGLAVLFPPVLNRIILLGLRILRRKGELPALEQRSFAIAVGWSILSWLTLGGALAALVAGTGTTDGILIVSGIPAYALSWVVGFIAVVVPAGLGVRESVLVLILGTGLTSASVLGIAVVHRVFMTLGDVVMLAFTIPARRKAKEIAPDPTEEP